MDSTLSRAEARDQAFGQAVIRKAAWRLIPFMILLYFISFLDRVNVGFAALTMNKELGFTSSVFGLGAGIFFFGYFLFEVPSNVIMEKVGARMWIARIMVTWGIISAAMATTSSESSFYIMRFLLGVAEAGFFPGMILYLTYWFPAKTRAKIIAGFMAAIPVSGLFGAPLSGWLLGMDGAMGLSGWQWMFIIEGLPAVVVGILVLFYLTDKPAQATWLSPSERDWLTRTIEVEEHHRKSHHPMTLWTALANPRVLALSLLYFCPVMALYGISLWLPQIVKGFGLTNLQVGFVAAIPYLVATIAMLVWGYSSDRSGERVWHVAIACITGCAGMAASAYLGDSPVLAMVALSVAAAGIYATLPTFWTLPTAFLSGTAAAGGIALINSLGNIGGFLGPYAVGAIRDAAGGSFTYPLLALAGVLLLGAIVVLLLGHDRKLERVAATAAE